MMVSPLIGFGLILVSCMSIVNTANFVLGLPSDNDIKSSINDRIDSLYDSENTDVFKPFVCCVCDEFILRKKDIATISVKKMKEASKVLSWDRLKDTDRIPAVEEHYRMEVDIPRESDLSWLRCMALSPRGTLNSRTDLRYFGFTSCYSCKKSVDAKKLPLNAIVNKNYVGVAPKELTDLNDVERAFLTPISSYGYCFTYQGGRMMSVRGQLTFMRVTEDKIATAATTLECMGLTKHIVVLISGKMTFGQLQAVKDRTRVRTDKLIAAVKWLVANHRDWKNVNFEKIKDKIHHTQPVRVDKSTTVQSGNASIEEEVVFTCYFPDGKANTHAGGFQSPTDFKEFVDTMKRNNYNIELKSEMEKEFVNGKTIDHLVGACVIQFPYGVGGLKEQRELECGKLSSNIDLPSFLEHLSRKSQTKFQTPLFQLIMYSMLSRTRLLRTSCLQLRNKVNAETLAQGFDAKDFSRAAKGRSNRKRRGTKASNILLDAVDATARDLPHTKEGSKKGRSSMEAMHHHFGMGSVFLTVTFDDENSFNIQVLSGIEIDDDTPIEDLSDKELAERASRRQSLRVEFPGIAALNFEMMLDILLEEVIGWDIDLNESTKVGLFGEVLAMAFAVEEQGRKTLHAHFILWIKGYGQLQQNLFFGDYMVKADAEKQLTEYFNQISTTRMFPTQKNILRKIYDHDNCSIASCRDREPPTPPDAQHLRHLRHKLGYEFHEGEFARCPHCDKKWTYEEMLVLLMEKGEKLYDRVTIPTDKSIGTFELPKVRKSRLLATCVEYQKPNSTVCPTAAINCAYQSHASNHHKNCFRCNKLSKDRKKKHKCGEACECQYRLPDLPRHKSTVRTINQGVGWFSWTGVSKKQPLLQIHPKRNIYDLFQNVSCAAVSESKFTCNSNVALITDGPIGMYTCKYVVKDTTGDDITDYKEVDESMKRMQGARHEDDKAEAMRLICRAAFAHNKSNVISASMASYLLRHKSRFYFSHEFVYCPLTDLVRLHNKQDVCGSVNVTRDGNFFENLALHYLCRPVDLEDLNPKNFFERYEVKFVPPSNKQCKNNPVVPFEHDTGHFQHPSAKAIKRGKNKGNTVCRQGVQLRDSEAYAKVSQWAWPDTAHFNKNILECSDNELNRTMDTYAQLALTLLLPHRRSEDLRDLSQAEFQYAHKLRQIFYDDKAVSAAGGEPLFFKECNTDFLQNIQNCRHNCLRYKVTSDELACSTDPFQNPDCAIEAHDTESESDDEEDNVGYEDFLQELEDEFERPVNDDNPDYLFPTLKNFSFQRIRENGDKKCGYREDLKLPKPDFPEFDFVAVTPGRKEDVRGRKRKKAETESKRTYSVKEINHVLLRKSSKSHQNVWKGKDIEVSDATGSIESIREWSKAGFGTDCRQQRAFEAIIASFVLTFYDHDQEAVLSETATTEEHLRFRRSKLALLKLKGRTKDSQLICLLHGPGGSGKSTVINMVKAYAKSYCEQLGHEFTCRTIVITAMSGVAATLINGETTHSCLGLNRKITTTHQAEFEDTRLVIIDEISFASVEDIDNIYQKLKVLVNKDYKPYGGVNVVFAGDYSQL